jgi:hypothetical protein
MSLSEGTRWRVLFGVIASASIFIVTCGPKPAVRTATSAAEYETGGIAAYKAQNYEESISLLGKAGDSPLANAYTGMAYLRLKKDDAAYPYLKKARNALDSIGDKGLKAMILFGWALYNDNKANFDESYFSYLDAQQLFWKIQDVEYSAKVCNNIAVLLGKVSWYEQSRRWFERAAETATDADRQRYKRLALQAAQLWKEQYKPPLAIINLSASINDDQIQNIETALNETKRFSVVPHQELNIRLKDFQPFPSEFAAVNWDEVGKTVDIDVVVALTYEGNTIGYRLYSIKYQKEYDTGEVDFNDLQQWVNRLCIAYCSLTYQLE